MIDRWLDRLPPAQRLNAARAVAIGAVTLVALPLGALSQAGVLLLLLLVRPLSILHGWLTRVRPAVLLPEAPVLAADPEYFFLRDRLVQAFGWATGWLLALRVATDLQGSLGAALDKSVLRGHEALLSTVLGVLAGAVAAWAVHGLPRRLQRARLTGRFDGRSCTDVLELGANLAVAVVFFELIRLGWPQAGGAHPLTLLILWGVFVVARLADFERRPAAGTLWVAVLPAPDSRLARAGTLRIVQALARNWLEGPVAVLLPADWQTAGEHRVAALGIGAAERIEPRLEAQLADWQQTLPPAERWAGVPLRELHLPSGLLASALQRLTSPSDKLLLIHPEGAPAEEGWLAALAVGGIALCRFLPEQSASNMDHGAHGLPRLNLAPLDEPTLRLVAAVGALVERLRVRTAPAASAPPSQVQRTAPHIPTFWRLGIWSIGGAVISIVLFMTLLFEINAASDPVFAALAAVRPSVEVPNRRSVPPPPPPPAAAGGADAAQYPPSVPSSSLRLAAMLKPETAAGLVQVQDRSTASRITLRRLFEPGTATLTAEGKLLVDRVADALARVRGTILVEGHTDNVPVRTLRYPSNWHLSDARAQAVAERLRARVAPERVRAEGRADSEPVAPNDTAANRERNRRIEVVVRTGEAPAAGGASAR